MGLSKNFSFWTVSLDLDAMFKIKLLLYKDLILNSRGCRKSNQLLRHPHAGIHKSMHLRNIGIVYTNGAVIRTAFVSNL